MRLELPPLPKPNAFRRSTSILPHILFWKRRRVAEKTIVEDWIAWKLTNESSICDRHEFALLQPQREFLGDECFGGKYDLVYLPFPHVHIAQLNAAGCECHFDVDLGEISWLPGMQPRSRSVNFLGQRIWLVRFPVEMGGDEQAELTASDQLGTSAKTGTICHCKTHLAGAVLVKPDIALRPRVPPPVFSAQQGEYIHCKTCVSKTV